MFVTGETWFSRQRSEGAEAARRLIVGRREGGHGKSRCVRLSRDGI